MLSAPDFRLVEALKKAFLISDETEFDIESDMAALQDPRNVEIYRTAGVKRISFGAQSFDEQVRKLAGIHDRGGSDKLEKCIDSLRKGGYGINYDLMFGLPGQSPESFLRDIRKSALNIAADHVDLLEFFPQPDAYFTRNFSKFKDLTADRDTRKKMYSEGRRFLLQNGFSQSTLTDFWQAQLKPSHFKTMLYRNADILGLGAGAHGILADCAYRNSRLDGGYLQEPWNALPLAFHPFLAAFAVAHEKSCPSPEAPLFCGKDFPGGITQKERAILEGFVKRGFLKRQRLLSRDRGRHAEQR